MKKEFFFKTSDGLWLYFEKVGTGPVILLIPGFGEATTMWRNSVDVLAETHTVVSLDIRGHGRSMKVAGNNRQERMSRDIKELIDHLGLEDVLLVGHSLGGALVASYAELQSEHRLRGMALVDASLHAFSSEDWNDHKARDYNLDGWNKRMQSYLADPIAYAERRRSLDISPKDADALVESMLQLPPFVGMEYHLDTYFTDNMTPLKNRTIPFATFVTRSAYHNAWKSGHEAVKRGVNSPLVECYEFTESNNHFFPIMEAEKFNNYLLDFSRRIEDLKLKKAV